MPTDIRSFFGAKSSQESNGPVTKPAQKKEDASTARKRRSRKIVDDSDDGEAFETIKSPIKTKAVKKDAKEITKGEVTTSSDYFGSRKKKEKNLAAESGTPEKKSNTPPASGNSLAKSPLRSKHTKGAPLTPSSKINDTPRRTRSSIKVVEADEGFGEDDIFAENYKKPGKSNDEYQEENSEDDSDDLAVQPATAASKRLAKRRSKIDEDDEDFETLDVPKTTAAKAGTKRKSDAFDKDDAKSRSSRNNIKGGHLTPKKAKTSSKVNGDASESKEIQAILDSIPTVRLPTPPPATGEPKKFNYMAMTSRSRDPAATGTKEIPVGAENCLAGLSFVFTGILDTLGREEGQSLVKRYGGKVTGGPSSKTSYVVLGSDAGPSKLKTIRNHGLKTINEDGLFELIRRLPANGGDGKAAGQYEAKQRKEEEKVKAMAAEMEAEDQKQQAAKAATKSSQSSSLALPNSQPSVVDDRLWTTKYAPTSLNMICGNKSQVEKLQVWLRNWRRNAKTGFKLPGKDGTGIYRAVMIHGPPGIGKTTAAHLVAGLEGYDVVETNASDTRSKKLVETGLTGVLDTTSLQGYFSRDGKKVESEKKNLVLIMDEVDGMSAGDRGGVGALASVAKKSKVPLILICNERNLPKMKPFDRIVYEMPFRRPTSDQIRARLSTICFREGLKIPPQILNSLIEGTHADIRQVINMLSALKVGNQSLDYDKGKEMSKAWEKHIILKPWDIVSQILSAQMFSQSSNSTLNDKIELYFNDHEFSHLMVQENYLKTNPVLAGNYHGKERSFKLLELAENAASSLSDGDLVDRMIHGSQQQWSLMPTHAVFSFVRPASFMYGNLTERPGFTSWLGQNSKHGKLGRFVKEIQGHMRLRAAADRHEIREQYFPLLWDRLVHRLMDEGKDSVDEVIDLMDSYFLTREDWDAMVELGVGPMDESMVKLESQTKATFTRVYNQRSHPLPFMKATSVVAPKKQPKERPDIEDAIDESDEEEEAVDADVKEDEEEELDLKKDKYVKVPKKQAARGDGGGKGKKATKAKKTRNEDDFIDDEDEKPKKNRKKKGQSKA